MDHSDDSVTKPTKQKFSVYELVSLDRFKLLRNWYVVTLVLIIILILLLGWGAFSTGNTTVNPGGNSSPVQGGDLITVNQVNNGYTVSFNKVCSTNEILRWSGVTNTWECSTEGTGGSNTYTSGEGLELTTNQFSVDSPACTFNEKLSWTGTAFVCLPDLVGSGSGVDNDSQTLGLAGNILSISNGNSVSLPTGVTLINTGNGLTGGPITTTGTVSVNAPTCLPTERLSWNGTAFVCLPAAVGAGITDVNGETGPSITLASTGPISVATAGNTVTYGLTACALDQVYMFNGVSWACTDTSALPLTNLFNLDRTTGFTSTVNGVAANEALAAGTLTELLGFDTLGNPAYQTVSSILTGATTNVFTTAGNVATSTVNGVVSFDDIINSNVLTVDLATGFTSTVNGIASSQAIPAGTITDVFGFDAGGNGVNQTIGSILAANTTNTLTWTQAGGITSTVNGVADTVATPAGTIVNLLGYDAGGNPANQSVATVLSGATTNVLDSLGNVMTSTVNGISDTANIINSVNFNLDLATGFTTDVNGVSDNQPIAGGTIVNVLGFDAGGVAVNETIASILTGNTTNVFTTAGNVATSTVNGVVSFDDIINTNVLNLVGSNLESVVNGVTSNTVDLSTLPCVATSSFFCQDGNLFGTTGTLGTNDNNDLVLETNGLERLRVMAGGNVGIGSNNPATLLSNASGSITDQGGVGQHPVGIFWQIGGPITPGYTATFHNGTPGVGANGLLVRNETAIGTSIFTANNGGVDRFTIFGNGNILMSSYPNTRDDAPAVLNILYTDAAGNLLSKDASTFLSGATTNVLDSLGNTMTSTVNGVSDTATIINSNVFSLNLAGGFTSNVNGVSSNVGVPVGVISNLLGFDAGGNPVNSSLANLPCDPTGDFFCQDGNSFGTSGVLGTLDNFDQTFIRNAVSIARITATGFDPEVDNTFDLGTLTNRWASLELGPGSLNITSTTGTLGAGANYTSLNQGFASPGSATIHTTNFGTNTAGNFGGMAFLSDRNIGQGVEQAFYFATKQNLSASDEVFQIENDLFGIPTPLVTVMGDGRVGILSTAPTALLSIDQGTTGLTGNSGLSMMGVTLDPALSVLGEGRMYFNSALGGFQCSENGAAYFDCFGAGGVNSVTAGLGLVNSGTGVDPIIDAQIQNGLSFSGDFIEWGGTLLHNTTITNNGFLPTFDSGSLTGTKGLQVTGDLTVTGVIDPIALMFSDPGIGVTDYQIGVTTVGNSRPIFVSNSVNRTDAFQVRKEDDTATVISVDTLNNRLGVGFNNTTPHSTLSTNGSFSVNYEDSSGGSINLDELNQTVVLTGPAVSANLPSAGGLAGRIYTIKNESGSTSGVNPMGLETIDGLSGAYALDDMNAVTLISDGANWHVIGSTGSAGIISITAGDGLSDTGTLTNPILNVLADNGLQVDAATDRVRLGGAVGSPEATNASLLFNTEVPLAGSSIGWSGQGNFGIGVAAPQEKLHVMSAGDPSNVLFEGTLNGMAVPTVFSSTTRMYWAPGRGAFRAGTATMGQWDNFNVGDNSAAFGLDTTASGANSSAFGQSTSATAAGASAFGVNTTASGINSAAFGFNTQATNQGATAFGQNTQANGMNSIAAGNGTFAFGTNSIAFGQSSAVDMSSENTIAGGNTNVAIGASSNSALFGQSNNLNGASAAIVAGVGNTVSGATSFTIGEANTSTGQRGIVFGQNNTTVPTTNNSIVGGQGNNNVDAENSAVFGVTQTVSGQRVVVGGQFNQVNFSNDVAVFGQGNQVQNQGSITGGQANQNFSNFSLVGGMMNQVSGLQHFAAGQQNQIMMGSENAATWGFSNEVVNSYGTAFGNNNISSGTGATAFGQNTTAQGEYSTSFGQGNTASGNNSLAFGQNTQATSFGATSFGNNTQANGPFSVAAGTDNITGSISSIVYGSSNNIDMGSDSTLVGGNLNQSQTSVNSILSGQGNTMTGSNRSLGIGQGNSITGTDSITTGNTNTNGGQNSIVFGSSNTLMPFGVNTILGGSNNNNIGVNDGAIFGFNQMAAGARIVAGGQSHQIFGADDSAVFGQANQVTGQASLVSGSSNTVPAFYSLVGGSGNNIQGSTNFGAGNMNNINFNASSAGVWGFSNDVSADYATAFGNNNNATGIGSTSFGNTTSAFGSYATSLGVGTSAQGDGAIALGEGTIASGQNSFAGGFTSTASDREAFAFGQNAQASGTMSVAFGLQNISSGTASFVGGNNSQAMGDSSFAYGNVVQANANFATAFGNGATANGFSSIAMGSQVTAGGTVSIAMGDGATASGERAVAFGESTESQGFAQTTIGRFNTVSGNSLAFDQSDQAFIIGNGTSDFARNNAFSVGWDAKMTLYGGFAPAVSPFGAGSMYFDTLSNTFQCSENNGAWFSCFGGGSLVGGDGIDITGSTISALADNGLQVDPVADRIRLGGAVGSPEATNASLLFDTEVPLAGNSIGWSGIGNFGIGVADPQEKLHIISNGDPTNVLFEGNLSGDPVPAVFSSTTRMYWAPGRSAFRAGTANGFQWGDANVGDYSTAFGLDTTASGTGSMSWGQQNEATGQNSTAWGTGSFAQDINATAWGNTTVASGPGATSFGTQTQAQATNSIAFGFGTVANGDQSTSWGEDTLSSGISATAFGTQTQALGDNGTAFGQNSIVGFGSTNSTAFGTATEAGTSAPGVENALAFGNQTQAQDDQATAFGNQTSAQGLNSTAFGFSTQALNDNSTAFGDDTLAQGIGSTAFGFTTQALGEYATAFGRISNVGVNSLASTAFGTDTSAGVMTMNVANALAFGNQTQAEANQATAFGNQSQAYGINSTAFGLLTQSQGDQSTAWGENSVAQGTNSTAFGFTSEALGDTSTAFGRFTTVGSQSFASTAWGTSTLAGFFTANVDNATAFGFDTRAEADQATSFGYQTSASGDNSLAFGRGTQSMAEQSTAFGFQTVAQGTNSTAFGNGAQAIGSNNTAFGNLTQTRGLNSMAWGDQTNVDPGAVFENGTAFGANTLANASQATAFGLGNVADGQNSTTWGESNVASGVNSTVFGDENVVAPSATLSTAWGSQNIVTGMGNTVWGLQNVGTGPGATVFGIGNITGSGTDTTLSSFVSDTYVQTIMGSYAIRNGANASQTYTEAITDNEQIFIIGNGEDDLTRSTAFYVTWNGDVFFERELRANGNAGNIGDVLLSGGAGGAANWTDSEFTFWMLDGNQTDGLGGNYTLGTTVNNGIDFTTNLVARMSLNANGELDVSQLTNGGASTSYVCTDASGVIVVQAGVCNVSSERYKSNISDLNNGLDTVMGLRPVQFTKNSDGSRSLGFIAEEVNVVDPRLAFSRDGRIEGVNYELMSAILTDAVQTQEGRLQNVEVQVNENEGRVDAVEASLNTLSAVPTDLQGIRSTILDLQNTNVSIQQTINNIQSSLTIFQTHEARLVDVETRLASLEGTVSLLQGGSASIDLSNLSVGNLIASGNVRVLGKLNVSEDTAGVATIETGLTFVTVTFSTPFNTVPVVTASPIGRRVDYYVGNITETSFDIILDAALEVPVEFNWISLGR